MSVKSFLVITHCDQACELKLRDIEERIKVLQKEVTVLDRRDNELLAEKKHLSEVKGKKRQLEQKISTKQDRYVFGVIWRALSDRISGHIEDRFWCIQTWT